MLLLLLFRYASCLFSQVNGVNVVKVGHKQVVSLIRQGGNRLLMKVVSVSRKPESEEVIRKKGKEQIHLKRPSSPPQILTFSLKNMYLWMYVTATPQIIRMDNDTVCPIQYIIRDFYKCAGILAGHFYYLIGRDLLMNIMQD